MIQACLLRRMFTKKICWLAVSVGLVLFVYAYYEYKYQPSAWELASAYKSIVIIDDGIEWHDTTDAETVGDFLNRAGLILGEEDRVAPGYDEKLLVGTDIIIHRAKTVSIASDGGTREWQTLSGTVEEALTDAGIALDEDDIVKPEREEAVHDGMKISVIRVEIREESVEKAVAFDKTANEDDTLSWRKTIVTQKGENGIDRLTYRVSSHDGKEVSRKLIQTERIKDPVTEITTQGTYVKVGKSHSGGASWYAYTGTMSAANPWLPLGSYVKVTNTANGKSVIVKINDRGPFVGGRIVDLDKVAFQKIASLGAGVINVKMEEIEN
jgi:resuscitation-promoting factor RpfB